MQLQQCNIVVQCLTVVIVMDVSCGNSQRLCPWAAEFASQIVITYPNVYCITRPNNAKIFKSSMSNLKSISPCMQLIGYDLLGDTVRRCQDPLRAN